MKKMSYLAGCCLLALYGQAQANGLIEQPTQPTWDDFGGTGLLQMPSARMAKAGEFSIGVNHTDPYTWLNVSLQPLSWLQVTARYTNIQGRKYGESIAGDQDYKDKSIDAKVRLWSESYYMPEIALGLRDFGGTGLFSGEYLVGSKRVGDFDLTLGIGWGYLGRRDRIRNPFEIFSSSYGNRPSGTSGAGGLIEWGKFFHGSTSLFGGIEYQTPWQPLTLKIEYDGNDYRAEPAGSPAIDLHASSPINYGANVHLGKYFDLRFGYERGNTWMLGVVMRTNFNEQIPNSHIDEPPAPIVEHNVSRLDKVNWPKLAEQMDRNAGYSHPRFEHQGDDVVLRGSQYKYRDPREGEDRAARLMANALPDDVAHYRIVDEAKRQPIREAVIPATTFKAVRDYRAPQQQLDEQVSLVTPTESQGNVLFRSKDDYWGFTLDPVLNQSIGGPDGFWLYQVGLVPGAYLWFGDHLQVYGSAYINLVDNMDKFKYTAPSQLPRVRTYIRDYLTDSAVRLNNLQLTYFDQFGQNWYSQLYGGYLELMYGGVGGQLLYRPLAKRWAIGAQLDAVKQRSFDDQFQFRDYKTITGHLTGYYQLPFENILAKVSVGRYLAKDWGMTLDLSKQFDNGIRAGFFVTKTDVSSSEFGEGSFNKGFYLSIPFDVLTVRPSTSRAQLNWVPLTRDGGAMLNHKYDLYQITSARSVGVQ